MSHKDHLVHHNTRHTHIFMNGIPSPLCNVCERVPCPTGTTPTMACMVCSTPSTRRYADCRGAFYCSRQHQRADWPVHRDQCVMFAHMRACVNCGRQTGRWCDFCESTFRETLTSPAANNMQVKGRALCSACDTSSASMCAVYALEHRE